MQLAALTAEERVRWVVDNFPGEAASSTSFGVQAAVMLSLVYRVEPALPVIFVDTGYLFPETYRFARDLCERLPVNLQTYVPRMTAARQEALFGRRWEKDLQDLDAYNKLNKVEPMNRALKELGVRAWMSGLRRTQSESRQNRQFIELQNQTYKIYPILDWSDKDIYDYLKQHDLPYHPLWDIGYVSVGDWHSTDKLGEGMRAEDTRFGGLKRECGLHELSGDRDFQI